MHSSNNNIVVGAQVTYREPVLEGVYPYAMQKGERTVTARVVKESYGGKRGQHTFTLEVLQCTGDAALSAGTILRKMGRNLYKGLQQVVLPAGYRELASAKAARRAKADATKYWNWIREAELNEAVLYKIGKIPLAFLQANRELLLRKHPGIVAYLPRRQN